MSVERWTPGSPPSVPLREQWRRGRAALVQIEDVDVVLAPAGVAIDALSWLWARKHPVGPVLADLWNGTVEIVVAEGTATSWQPLAGTSCTADAVIRCPSPEFTVGRRRTADRAWIVPPVSTLPATTDADLLHEVLAQALAEAAEEAGS